MTKIQLIVEVTRLREQVRGLRGDLKRIQKWSILSGLERILHRLAVPATVLIVVAGFVMTIRYATGERAEVVMQLVQRLRVESWISLGAAVLGAMTSVSYSVVYKREKALNQSLLEKFDVRIESSEDRGLPSGSPPLVSEER